VLKTHCWAFLPCRIPIASLDALLPANHRPPCLCWLVLVIVPLLWYHHVSRKANFHLKNPNSAEPVPLPKTLFQSAFLLAAFCWVTLNVPVFRAVSTRVCWCSTFSPSIACSASCAKRSLDRVALLLGSFSGACDISLFSSSRAAWSSVSPWVSCAAPNCWSQASLSCSCWCYVRFDKCSIAPRLPRARAPSGQEPSVVECVVHGVSRSSAGDNDARSCRKVM